MREIKFELVGRNKKFGNIVRDIYTLEQLRIGDDVLTFFAIGNDNCEMLAVRQYTGLKDNNGKEIYEGDILKIQDENYSYDAANYQVAYFGDRDYPAFDLIPDIDCDSNGLSYVKAAGRLEVIGNIYENRALLEH
jgi:uncharacterized phage protein (TIGR01671 family)